jgi:hypothetical protein
LLAVLAQDAKGLAPKFDDPDARPPHDLQIGLAVKSQEMASPAAKLFVETALAWKQVQAV